MQPTRSGEINNLQEHDAVLLYLFNELSETSYGITREIELSSLSKRMY